jgi:hypothetical protein
VIVAVPAEIATTFPLASTVAMLEFEVDHVTVLLEAFEGLTVAESVEFCPSSNDKFPALILTPVTAIVAGFTVTEQAAVFPPSTVVTVIVQEPTPNGDTTPLLLTFATKLFDELQITLLFVAFEGLTVAVKFPIDPPAVNVIEDLSKLTLVT